MTEPLTPADLKPDPETSRPKKGHAPRSLKDWALRLSPILALGALVILAFAMGWISREALLDRAKQFGKNGYGEYLARLASDGS